MKQEEGADNKAFLQALQAGEEGAFARVHGEHWERLIDIAYALTGSMVEAKDLAAETLARLFESRKTMKSPAHVVNFLTRVLRNKAIDRLRKSGRDAARFKAFLTLYEEEAPGSASAHEHELQYTQRAAWFYRSVERLPARERLVLELYLAGHSTAHIARVLQLSPQTVLNHKSRAVRNLRRKRSFWLLTLLLPLFWWIRYRQG